MSSKFTLFEAFLIEARKMKKLTDPLDILESATMDFLNMYEVSKGNSTTIVMQREEIISKTNSFLLTPINTLLLNKSSKDIWRVVGYSADDVEDRFIRLRRVWKGCRDRSKLGDEIHARDYSSWYAIKTGKFDPSSIEIGDWVYLTSSIGGGRSTGWVNVTGINPSRDTFFVSNNSGIGEISRDGKYIKSDGSVGIGITISFRPVIPDDKLEFMIGKLAESLNISDVSTIRSLIDSGAIKLNMETKNG